MFFLLIFKRKKRREGEEMGRERKIRQKSIGRLRYCTNRWRYRQMVILDRDAGATFRDIRRWLETSSA